MRNAIDISISTNNYENQKKILEKNNLLNVINLVYLNYRIPGN